MQALIIKYQGSCEAWFGPVQPIRGAYPLFAQRRISDKQAADAVAALNGTWGGFQVTGYVVTRDDGKSEEQDARECDAIQRAERRAEHRAATRGF